MASSTATERTEETIRTGTMATTIAARHTTHRLFTCRSMNKTAKLISMNGVITLEFIARNSRVRYEYAPTASVSTTAAIRTIFRVRNTRLRPASVLHTWY